MLNPFMRSRLVISSRQPASDASRNGRQKAKLIRLKYDIDARHLEQRNASPTGCALHYHLLVQRVLADHNVALLALVPMFPQIYIALVRIPFGVAMGLFLEFVFRMGENVTYEGAMSSLPLFHAMTSHRLVFGAS